MDRDADGLEAICQVSPQPAHADDVGTADHEVNFLRRRPCRADINAPAVMIKQPSQSRLICGKTMACITMKSRRTERFSQTTVSKVASAGRNPSIRSLTPRLSTVTMSGMTKLSRTM